MKVVIAGGGTGGHLFPGVAIAEEVRARDPHAEVTFVGTARGIEARVLPDLGWPLELIEVSGLKTVGFLSMLLGLLRIPRSLWQARRILRRARPDVVVGVGGYASGPVVMMARLSRIPAAILEQNSVPGLTNKILGKLVPAVFVAFDETRRHFAARRVHMTGNPIRAGIRRALAPESEGGEDGGYGGRDEADAEPRAGDGEDGEGHEPREEDGEPRERDGEPREEDGELRERDAEPREGDGEPRERAPRILAVGGSQGAVALNAAVADAMAELARRGLHLDIVHQTGERGFEDTRNRYESAGVPADCRPFIRDMAGAYRSADLVIARAGATTVAELGVVGRPAILVPYPYAADNHQEINAKELVDGGAALLFRQFELEPGDLADAVARIVESPETLEEMGAAMRALGRPDAAAEITSWCEAQRHSE